MNSQEPWEMKNTDFRSLIVIVKTFNICNFEVACNISIHVYLM